MDDDTSNILHKMKFVQAIWSTSNGNKYASLLWTDPKPEFHLSLQYFKTWKHLDFWLPQMKWDSFFAERLQIYNFIPKLPSSTSHEIYFLDKIQVATLDSFYKLKISFNFFFFC